MLPWVKSLLHLAPCQPLNFVPLCRLPPGTLETWHHCPPMILSDEAYDRLHEFLQANLEGKWSLLMQDCDRLDKYNILLEIETEMELINLFRITIGMPYCEST
jgi:hypothetical protein